MFEKQRKLFVDIDGTLAVWQVGTPYEELLKRGYFRNLPAHESVVQAVRMLIAEEKELGFETYALSALMPRESLGGRGQARLARRAPA